MSDAIVVENLSKVYSLGSDAQNSRVADLFMPWKRLPQENEFWALKDISFKIEAGESVGIIGRNGAGKSTLLKILSRITAPTTGRVTVRGRVGTLLEVGTGFHPELSGRDNIFLSGTILGMPYDQVVRRLDEIIDFSGVEKFIDTPVKRYSSGMQVKLAFAVALFLEPEILIVDEVLSVGDLEFQRKSLRRLNEVTGREGRTVLFVSHGLDSIKKSCSRVIVLEGGRMGFDGDAKDGVDYYKDSVPFEPESVRDINMKNRRQRTQGGVRFTRFEAIDSRGKPNWSYRTGDAVRFRVEYEAIESVRDLMLTFRILTPPDDLSKESEETIITNIYEIISRDPLASGHRGAVEIEFPSLNLRSGSYLLRLYLGTLDDKINFDVIDDNIDIPELYFKANAPEERLGIVSFDYKSRAVAPEAGSAPLKLKVS